MAIPAELAYFFRQPILRDAAYQLQVPSERARLHRMAIEILEAMFDGPPPEPEPDQWGDLKCEPHTIDPVAADLADHIRGIRGWEAADDSSLLARELLYTRRAAEYTETQFDNDAAVRLWQRLAEVLGESDPAVAAEALRRAGAVLANSGRAPEAEPLFERSRSMAVEAGSRRIEGVALSSLGVVYRMTGRVEEAERIYGQSLAIHRETDDRRREGIALGNLANIYQEIGRTEEAERTYGKALAIHRGTGNRASEGIALGNLANVYRQTGRLEESERTDGLALAIHRETGNRRSEGIALGNLAGVYLMTGRLDEAERTYGQALGISRETGHRAFEGAALGNLALLYQETGRLEEAREMFERALAISRETRGRRFEGLQSCNFALCLLTLKQPGVRDVWRTGAAILLEVGDAGGLDSKTTEMHEACAKAGVPPFDE